MDSTYPHGSDYLSPEDLKALNHLRDQIVATTISKGFRDPPKGISYELWQTESFKGLRAAIFAANLHGETSELWEAARKGILHQPCDKLPELTNAEEEIADIIIRALDLADFLGVNPARAVALKARFNASREHRHGGKLF